MKYWLRGAALMVLMLAVAGLAFAQEEPEREELIAAVMDASEPEVIDTRDSFDAAYQAQVTVYDCVQVGDVLMAYETLEVIDAATEEARLITDQLRYCEGLGAYGLHILRFSDNNRFLYYTDSREGTPDGAGYWIPWVYRADLVDLSSVNLGGGVFSDDGRLITGWDANARTITVWDVNDGTALGSFEPAAPETYLTMLSWLPDGSGLIYILSNNFMMGTQSWVVHIDLSSGEQKVLLETSAE